MIVAMLDRLATWWLARRRAERRGGMVEMDWRKPW